MKTRNIMAAAAVASAIANAPVAPAQTQDSRQAVLRPVQSVYGAEGGTAHLADTYLTPLHYDGWHTGLFYSRAQSMRFAPHKWSQQLRLAIDFDDAQNPARNASMLYLGADVRWGMMRRFDNIFAQGLSASVGPEANLTAGALYLSRNGNNPVAAKGAFMFGATGRVQYQMRIGRLPVTFHYAASLPTVGLFFSPDYGQLYYEIWLGERRGLCNFAWWGTRFAMDNRIGVTFGPGTTGIEVAYHNYVESSKANNLVTRRTVHALSVGITCRWLSMPMTHTPTQKSKTLCLPY